MKKAVTLSPEIIAAARQPFLRSADIRSTVRPIDVAPNADAESIKVTIGTTVAPSDTVQPPDEGAPVDIMSAQQENIPVEPEPESPADVSDLSLDPVVLVRSETIVRSALSYRGAPYRLGATGRYGAFDCSSFTRHILGQNGANLPRTAAEQYHRGQPVDRDSLQPGDLVFFRNTYKSGISHVGIYIGNDKFVHASNRRTGVTVTGLSTAYYSRHYAGARRVR